MVTVHREEDRERLVIKGAPESILPMCSQDSRQDKGAEVTLLELTRRGLRVLALAEKRSSHIPLRNGLQDLTFLGLIGMEDPLREHAVETVKDLNGAGIHLVIVTGDHLETAVRVAQGAGFGVKKGQALTGAALDEISDEELAQRITNINVFARVEPHDKIRIVNAWKAVGKTVAMTGDGVNDAPALKAADIGVALGAGSDVSHEIADIVLLDNNLSTISAAVHQGRLIFDNIRKVVIYLMVDSFSEIVLILFSLLVGAPLPMTAVQILWINLVTDGFPDVALTMEPAEVGIMKELPRPRGEPVINREMKILIFIIGLITDIGLFSLYLVLLKSGIELSHIRTIMFTALGIDSLLYVFSVRTLRGSLFTTNPFRNPWLLGAVVIGFVIQLSALYVPPLQKLLSTVPLTTQDWLIIVPLSLIKIVCIEGAKGVFFRKKVSV